MLFILKGFSISRYCPLFQLHKLVNDFGRLFSRYRFIRPESAVSEPRNVAGKFGFGYIVVEPFSLRDIFKGLVRLMGKTKRFVRQRYEFCSGDDFIRLKGSIGVARDQSIAYPFFYFFLGPMTINVI
nr:hypothetical protein [Paenibacillus sp. URB8-2]